MSRFRSSGPKNEASYVEFVAARQRYFRRLAYAICGDWHLAEDLLQTALTKLYVAWPRVHGAGNEDAYLRQIIVRANIDAHRRRARRPEFARAELPEVAQRDELSVEDRDELFTALLALPPMQRKVILLRHWLGLSVAETALDLGIQEGTVKSHSARALATLNAQLDPPSEGSSHQNSDRRPGKR